MERFKKTLELEIGIFGVFGLPILYVLGWQSEANCGLVVGIVVGYDGKFLR